MNYDAMGSYYGPALDAVSPRETEANVKPVTQTITTDPTTGEQMMTVKGRPEDLSAANPNTPTVVPVAPAVPEQMVPPAAPAPQMAPPPAAPAPQPAPQPAPAPVAPATDANFQRMLQAESGNQQFTPQGQIVTSPKGALGAAQIMPATAASPGYGVAPATPEEIATPEGNRAFGQRYYQGLLQHFGGDQQKATAAYNAGPGRVQQNIAANQGQMNVSQLPAETQGYLQKVNAPAPGAQPPAMIAGQPSSDVGYTPTEQAVRQTMTPEQRYVDQFIKSQTDPEAMARLRYDKNAPTWARELASQREYQNLKHQQETDRVKEKFQTAVENGDGRTIARMISDKKDEEGITASRVARAFLFNLIGFQSGAAAEVEKMGLKDKWDIGRLGDADVTVKFNPRGEAKEAVYTSGERAGERVSRADLPMLSGQGGAAGKGKADVSTQDVEKNGMAGRVITQHRGDTTTTYVESGGKKFPYDTSWQPRSIATAASKSDMQLINNIKEKFGKDAITFLTEYQRVKGIQTPEAQDEILARAGLSRAFPTGQTPAPAQLPATGPTTAPAPVAMPGAPSVSQQNQMPGAQQNMRVPGPVAPAVPTQPVTAPAGAAPTAPVAPVDLTTPMVSLEAQAKAEGANVAKNVNKSYNAQSIYNVIEPINTALKTATDSGLMAKVDDIAAFFGQSTKGAQGAAQLNILADTLLKTVPRFEGPQSDRDTAAYAAASGQLADRTVPTATRVAALKTIIDINKKYAPELDWSFGADKKAETSAAGGGAKIETPQERARREIEKRKSNI